MAPKLAFIECLIAKYSVQVQHENFKRLGIAKFAKVRGPTGPTAFIELKSNFLFQWNLFIIVQRPLKAISKTAVLKPKVQISKSPSGNNNNNETTDHISSPEVYFEQPQFLNFYWRSSENSHFETVWPEELWCGGVALNSVG